MSNQEEQLKILQQQKALLTEQLAVAQLQQQITALEQPAAAPPKLTAGKIAPQAGSVAADENFGYLSQLVATQALRDQALTLAKTVKQKLTDQHKVLITESLDLAAGDLPRIQLTAQFAQYATALQTQIDANAAQLQPVLEPPAPAYSHSADTIEFGSGDAAEDTTAEIDEPDREAEMALSSAAVIAGALQAAPVAVGLLADVAGYFQADYTLSGQQFDVTNTAVMLPVAGVLGAQCVIANAYFIADAPLLNRYLALQEQRRLLVSSQALLQALCVAPVSADIAALQQQLKKAAEADKAALQQELGKQQATLQTAQAAVTRTTTLVEAFDAYSQAVTASQGGNPSPLVQAALREQLLAQEITHVLMLNVLSSGGEAITKRTWWRGTQTGYVGGGALAYALLTRAGVVLAADTVTAVAELTASRALNGDYSARAIDL